MAEYKLRTPLNEDETRRLRIGDIVWLTGVVYTARDMAHKHFAQKSPGEMPFKLEGGAIYHCGPIVKKQGNTWSIMSCGPTTSSREEPYEAEVIKRYGLRAIIGKGGMGAKTLEALAEHGCVYLAAVGGAGAAMADAVKKVAGTYMLEEFGTPEAVWALEVENLGPLTVAMDSTGESLYKDVENASRVNVKRIYGSLR